MAFKEIHILSKKERKKIIKEIRKQLSQKREIIFAYLYGSFLEDPCFRDIDIGIYLNEKVVEPKDFFPYQLKLSGEIKIPAKYSLDIRILNEAPFSFLVSVFSHGKLLFSRNDQFLADLIERVSIDQVAEEAFSIEAFRELTS